MSEEAITPASSSPQEAEVVCPGCGMTLVGESPRATAAWFCPRCDYPLFWATDAGSSASAASVGSRAARQRLPGTGGRVVLGAEPCWHCGEMSKLGEVECRRCAATLPKPLAPKVFVDVEVGVPVPYAVRPVMWPYMAAAMCASSAIAVALTSWLSGGQT
ncbi:MAG: DNA-directed RNA polymerase subunit RPC12/RpoP [Glaciecola sp.]|jgi:DNA-directed RNA polymerase subunit RPC12/RpoP